MNTTVTPYRPFLAVILAFLAWAGPGEQASMSGAAEGTPANPTLFEARKQCNQLAAFFTVDPVIASQWVPPPFQLAIDAQGQATGALIVLDCPDFYFLRTPNGPPLEEGENLAPAAEAHFWMMLQGPFQVLPVPGALVTAPTQYFYSLADLHVIRVARTVYRRAGRNAIPVSEVTLVDQGNIQAGEITFTDGSKITYNAHTPTQLPQPLPFGGNTWTWHAGDDGEIGDGGDRGVNTTRVMFLSTVPGAPNSTHVTIHAEPGTGFADFYGRSDVVSSRATFFRPNNIVLNSSRGDLAWTTYPPDPIPVPPAFP